VLTDDWHGRLRLATQRDPVRAFDDFPLDEAGATLGAGVTSLLAGDLSQATRQLAAAASDPDAGPALLAGAQLAYAIALVLGAGSTEAHQIDLAEEAAERVEVAWLARLARAALALTDRTGVLDGDEPVWAMCDSDGDEWGGALALFFNAWQSVKTGDPIYETTIAEVIERFHRLKAPVLVAWAQSLLAIGHARSGRAEATKCATVAERRARALQVAGPRALAVCALDLVEGSDRGLALLRNCAIEHSGFIRRVDVLTIEGTSASPPGAAHRVQLFGSFELLAGEAVIDLKALRPRVRSLVRFLALNSGKLVHREAVLEALWPNAGFDSGRSNLHTAISAARQVLEPYEFTIERESDSYRFITPPGTTWDTAEFQTALQSAHKARSNGDSARAYDDFAQALSLYTDDLLTEEGPSEWIVAHRERSRNEAVNAAIAAAEIALANDRHADVIAACERAVVLDPCADRAWRLLTSAFERSGSLASAQRARQAYVDVQQRLGIAAHDIESDRAVATT
jgi:DNA-binding SARP family transcriptional activator